MLVSVHSYYQKNKLRNMNTRKLKKDISEYKLVQLIVKVVKFVLKYVQRNVFQWLHIHKNIKNNNKSGMN